MAPSTGPALNSAILARQDHFCQGDAKVSEEGKQEQEDEVAEK